MGKVPNLPVGSKQLPHFSLTENLSSPSLVILGKVIMAMHLFHSINSFKCKYNNSFIPIPIDFMAMKLFRSMQLAAVSSTLKDETG